MNSISPALQFSIILYVMCTTKLDTQQRCVSMTIEIMSDLFKYYASVVICLNLSLYFCHNFNLGCEKQKCSPFFVFAKIPICWRRCTFISIYFYLWNFELHFYPTFLFLSDSYLNIHTWISKGNENTLTLLPVSYSLTCSTYIGH